MDAKGWKPKQLAEALQHKHAQTVNFWLSEEPKPKGRDISIKNVERVAKVLGVTAEALDPGRKESYDPDNRPEYSRRGRSRDTDAAKAESHTPASLLHSGNPPYPAGGTLMPDEHDPALFQLFAGVWVNLSHDERQACYDLAASFFVESHAKKSRKAKNK